MVLTIKASDVKNQLYFRNNIKSNLWSLNLCYQGTVCTYFLTVETIAVLQNTALHLATMDNKPNAVALLLSMNCKLLYNCHDMSAIDYAIYYKFPEAALAMVTHEER